jgi:hypothetical protein
MSHTNHEHANESHKGDAPALAAPVAVDPHPHPHVATDHHMLRVTTSGPMLTSPMSAPLPPTQPAQSATAAHGGLESLAQAAHVCGRDPPHSHPNAQSMSHPHPQRSQSMPQLHVDVDSPTSITHLGGDDEVHTPHGAEPDPAEGTFLSRPVPPAIDPHSRTQWRRKAHGILESKQVHIVILSLVALDLLVVMAEIFIGLFGYQQCLEYAGPEYPYEERHWIHEAEDALRWTSVGILSIFVVETLTKFVVLGWRYYAHHPLHIFDAVVIGLSFFTSIFLPAGGPIEEIVGFFILLRLWRVFRIIDGVAIALHAQHASNRHKLKAEMKALREQVACLQEQLLRQCAKVREMHESEAEFAADKDAAVEHSAGPTDGIHLALPHHDTKEAEHHHYSKDI